MVATTARQLSISDIKSKQSTNMERSKNHERRQRDRWQPYQNRRHTFQRPLFSSMPSPEISPKPSPLLMEKSFPQIQKQSTASATNAAQLPSPPPSDKSDQSDKVNGQLQLLAQTTAKARLQKILADPVHWVSATQKTFDTETTPITRSQSMTQALSKPIAKQSSSEDTIARSQSTRDQPWVAVMKSAADDGKKDSSTSLPANKGQRHPEQLGKDQVIKALVQSGRISKAWPSFARNKKPRGLHNPSQYCYRRSVMQAFLQTPVFISWLAGHQRSAECPRSNVRCIACAFQALLRKYYSGEPVHQATRQFDSFFNTLWPQTKGIRNPNAIHRLNSSQQDADEFVHGLLDAFCNSPSRTLPMSLDIRKALFEVTVSRTWFCLNKNCSGREHTNVQSERGLILDIQKPRENLSVKDYIWEYFRGDIVDDVTCDVCGLKKQRRRQRHMQLLAGPEILIIQLCRFGNIRFDGRRFKGGQKIRSPVKQIRMLDLSTLQPKQYQGQNDMLYELKHIVLHAGASISSGHYLSICSSPDGMYECNDETIRAWTNSSGMGGANPYLLVYTKT